MAIPLAVQNYFLSRYPLSEWLLYHAYDPKEELYYLADGRWGMTWVANPLTGLDAGMQVKLQSIFEYNFPPRTTIQIALHGSRFIQPILDRYVALRANAHPDDQAWARRVAAFYRERTTTRVAKTLPVPVRNWQCYISATIPGSHDPSSAKAAKEHLLNLGQSLRNIGLHMTVAEPVHLLRVLYELCNPGHDIDAAPLRWNSSQPLSQQVICYDSKTVVRHNHLEIDGWHVIPLSVQQYPEQWHGAVRELIGRSLHSFDQISAPCWITMTALRLPQQKASTQLTTRHALAVNQSFNVITKFVPMIAKKRQQLDLMMDALADGRHLWAVGHQCIIYAPSAPESEQAAEDALGLYRSLGFQLQRDQYIGLLQFLNALPMQAPNDPTETRTRLRRLKTQHSGVLAALCPLVADWKGTANAPVLLYTTRSGQLVGYDLFANPSGNYNVCIAAKSGAGKSFWVNDLIRSYLSTGGRVWMIDAGNSYRTLAELLGDRAAYIQWSQESHTLALNPFASATDCEPDTVTQIRGILGQMLSPSRPLSDWERPVLDEIIATLLMQQGPETTITDVKRRLLEHSDSRARDMGTQLSPYAQGGMYAAWFSRSGRIPWDAPFIVLELDGLQQQQELRSVILLQLLLAIQHEMYLGDRAVHKICGMDEAWDLLSKAGHASDFFETGVRRVRKYNGSIVVITQGVDDFYGKIGAVGRALLQNSDYLVLPMQKPESIESIKQSNQLSMSEWELKALESLHKTDEYAEFMFCMPTGKEVLRHIVDEHSKLVYTTKPDDLATIAQLSREHGISRVEAVRLLAELRTNQRNQHR